MTKEQIAQWASEAEAHANTLFDWVTQEEEWHAARNERFAVLATAAEREACAQLCELWNASHPERLAAEIRARGKP